MAAALYRSSGSFLSSSSTGLLPRLCRLSRCQPNFTFALSLSLSSAPITLRPITTVLISSPSRPRWDPLLFRSYSSSTSSSNTNSPASFDWSDDEDDDDDDDDDKTKTRRKTMKDLDKSKLPPPYDPFSKKPVVEEPRDPSDLQEIFHKMRTEGLTKHAIKMFDALSKDGLTHEAMELFAIIKDKGTMPDVVAHTAVMEAYANAGGHSKEAIRTFDRMLASGVSPNAYTYTVLIKGLARDGRLPDARNYLLEMLGKRGMRPNAATYLAVFEAYLRDHMLDEARDLLEEMKAKGFVPDEKAVREHLSKRGQVLRNIISLLFGNRVNFN